MSDTNSKPADAHPNEDPRNNSSEDTPKQSKEQSPALSENPSSQEEDDNELNEQNGIQEEKEKAESSQSPAPDPTTHSWQAIWSPQYNAYYFYNSETQETTWSNPLTSTENPSSTMQPELGKSSQQNPAQTMPQYEYDALQAAAIAQGIDPGLAFLDPSLAAGPAGSSSHLAFTAKFNAKSGAFARPDARDPSHMSEFERAKRMSEFYFDVGAWESEVAERHQAEAEGGKKRKRPTKKDLERFKEQKKQKKIAKTAWLRT